MAVSDQFCLRWNDHQNTLMTTFDTLLDSQKLTDVTLFAGGKSLKAHKVVLSACSPYFDKMLEVHDEKNPIIVFNDLSYDQLRAMLEYMYRGEVNVSQEQLDSFLKVAESLKIKGLTDQGGGGDIKGGGSKKKPLSTPMAKERSSPAGKRRRPNRRGSESGTESLEEETKSEPGGLLQPKIELTEDNGGGGVEDLTMEEEEDDDGYYHHQGASSSRLTDGSVQPPHPPPDIKDFASWEMTNDSFMGAQDMSGNNALNSSQVEEELGSLSNPLAVIVLREDEVLEEEVGEEEVVEEEDMSTLEIYNEQSKIICHYCGAEFAEETELDKHSSSCTSNLEYECAICGATFLSEHGLRSHVRVHADGSTCEKCGKYFRTPASLDVHQKEECGLEQTLECILCSRSFPSKSQLNAHLIESHSEAKIVVPQQLEQLEQSQSSEEQYQCKLCPRSFTRVGSLNYHVSRQHSGDNQRSAEEFPYLCMNCGNRYKSSTQLCRHRRWECGKEPLFKCQLCVKKFHHRHGLKQHIRLHMAKKRQSFDSKSVATAQFCCEKCGRGYKLKSSLNNHIKWECGKEPVFPCSVCHVRFSHKGNLKKHILTKHVGKQPLIETRKEE